MDGLYGSELKTRIFYSDQESILKLGDSFYYSAKYKKIANEWKLERVRKTKDIPYNVSNSIYRYVCERK